MALNFPSSPSNGQEYVAPNGVTYIYDSAAGLWYVKTSDAIGTTDINDGAITTAKLANDAVTGGKLANDITISTTGDLTANSLTLPTGAPVVGYQQGTVTVTSNANMNSQAAYWIRVGNWVRVQAGCVFSGGQSSTDHLVMNGLPYNRQPNGAGSLGAANSCAGYICYVSGSTARTVLFGAGNEYQFREGNNSFSVMSIAGLSASDTRWVLEYITDDTTWTPLSGATVS